MNFPATHGLTAAGSDLPSSAPAICTCSIAGSVCTCSIAG